MDIVLHVGAHGTGTQDIQEYLRRHEGFFASQNIGVLTPKCPGAKGTDMAGNPKLPEAADWPSINADKGLGAKLEEAQRHGITRMVISNADRIGTVADNMARGTLYASAGHRLACSMRDLDARSTTVLLSISSLDVYWCSVLAHGVAQGQPVPHRDKLSAIAHASRGWRDVVEDIASAQPEAIIKVLPVDTYHGRPDLFLADGLMTDTVAQVRCPARNATPTLPVLRRCLSDRGQSPTALPFGMGRWNPFTSEEHAALREVYADDLMWLTAGASGLATLTEDRHRERTGQTLPLAADRKGRRDDIAEKTNGATSLRASYEDVRSKI